MKPLVTFAVAAFQQARFVAEAVEGALAQTYSPLEVILSDDASQDHTFEIMQELAACYRGPHKVILNRNKQNLGLARHVNRINQLAHGELIVGAAGDDISLPWRTEKVFEAWDSTGRSATFIHGRVIHVDEHGQEILHPTLHNPTVPTYRVVTQTVRPSHYAQTLEPEIIGASDAWSPIVFKVFGDLPQETFHEDNAIAFRSVLLGGMLFIDTPLVKYRRHGSNIFNARQSIADTLDILKEQERRLQRNFSNRTAMYRIFGQDLLTGREQKLISEEEFAKALAIAKHRECLQSLQCEFMGASTIRKASLLFQLARCGATAADLKRLFVRLLPTPLFQSAKLAKGWLHTRQPLAGSA